MKKSIKKRILAFLFMLISFGICMLAYAGILEMYESKVFIPVIVGGKYILANRIVRTTIYIILAIICYFAFFGTMYYFEKLTAKPKRRRRKNK